MRGGYPPLLEIISGPSTRQRAPVCRHRLIGDRRSTTPVLDREEASGDCASTPALMRWDCQRYGCECLLPAEECPGQIKGRLRRRPPFPKAAPFNCSSSCIASWSGEYTTRSVTTLQSVPAGFGTRKFLAL